MSLQLIIGGSGSGKTELLYRDIIRQSLKQPAEQFFVIVPEQATMQAQREIVRLHPRHGTMNIDIVSFQRLAYRIFSELSAPQPQLLDDCGKTMVLRKLAGERKKEIPMFASHLHQAGFIDEIKSMISEFYQYEITPDMLAEQGGASSDSRVLGQKLHDMEVLYRAFREYTKTRFITMEEILDVLCRELPRSRLIRHSVVALDGYTGFTPVQYRLIGLLLQLCRQVRVTVAAPDRESVYGSGRESDLFDMSRKMAGKLMEIAKKSGTETEPDILLGRRPYPRFCGNSSLDVLEQEFYRYRRAANRNLGEPEGIHLVRAENPADEVDYVVNTIHQLVKKEGYRYRDIAVVCADLPGYSGEILHQFEENKIPVFLDEKKNVMGNPFIRLIRGSLEILWKDFRYEGMFQYLRTGLVSGEEEMIDRLENYVRAMGIRGFKRWASEWGGVCDGARRLNLEEMNVFRRAVMEPLSAFREAAQGGRGAKVETVTAALVGLFETLRVEEKLLERASVFFAGGEYARAREYEQIYPLVMDLFTRMVDLLGEEKLSKKEYEEILNAGLAQIQVGVIPACVDRVVAGDLKRTRLDKIRALFFVGANDGVVPADTDKGGILTEQEREILKSRRLELAPTAREESFMQRFYLYLMFTKPEERLYLSYPAFSAGGKAMRPSGLIGQLQWSFPELEARPAAEMKAAKISARAATGAVIAGLEDFENMGGQEEFRTLFWWLSGEEAHRAEMERFVAARTFAYKERGIGREAARELYGQILSGSVTRMEGYAACAYAHFLNYGLELKKRKEYELELSDMGNLFHRSIDLFFRQVKEEGRDFRSITEEERKARLSACVGQVTEEYGNTIMKSSARNGYLGKKVERIADRTVRALIHQIRKGDFEPEEFEVKIERKIPISGTEAIELRGRIDRVDTYEDGDKVYVKIMDYKSGSTSFDMSLLYHGLQVQLVVYMDATMAAGELRHPGKKAVPAGIFYYHIDDPVVERQDEMAPEAIEAAVLRKLRMNGLVNSDLDVIRHLDREIEAESDVIPVAMKNGMIQEARSSVAGGDRFEKLAGFVNRSLKNMGREILDGNTAVNPYKQGTRTACDYCPYHSVCGFDLKTGGYSYRRLKNMKAEEIWEKIAPASGGREAGGAEAEEPEAKDAGAAVGPA